MGGLLVTKAEKIAEMLRRYEEARETLNGPSGIPGDGDLLGIMPVTWNASFRELERCLVLLREDAPTLYWHLTERYLRCETRRITVSVKNARPKLPPHTELAAGQWGVGDKRAEVLVRGWSASVRAVKVERGLRILAAYFEGEPYLPVEMVAA